MMLSLLFFELKKLMKNKAAIGGILIALLILFGFFYGMFFNGQLSGYSSDEISGREAVALNQQIAEEHTGTLSDDLIKSIIVDSANNEEEYGNKGFFDTFSWYIRTKFILNYDTYSEELKSIDTDGHFDSNRVDIKSVNDLELTLPVQSLRLGNFAPWNQLFELIGISFILMGLLSIYLCASVFSGDTSKNMMPLLLTTKFGKTKLVFAKLLSVLMILTSIFLVTNLIILLVFGYYFSFSGWDTSIQLNFYWDNLSFPVAMNFLELFVLLMFYQYTGLLFVVGLTCLVSHYAKSTFTSLAVSLGVFFLPQLLVQLFKSGLINKFLTFFPIVNTTVEKMLMKLSSTDGFIFKTFFPNVFLLIVVMFISSIICFIIIIYNLRQKDCPLA